MDVGILWSYVVEKTGEHVENLRPWTGDKYPATSGHRRMLAFCGHTWWRKPDKHVENLQPLDGRPLPCYMRTPADSIRQASALTIALSRPLISRTLTDHCLCFPYIDYSDPIRIFRPFMTCFLNSLHYYY